MLFTKQYLTAINKYNTRHMIVRPSVKNASKNILHKEMCKRNADKITKNSKTFRKNMLNFAVLRYKKQHFAQTKEHYAAGTCVPTSPTF